MNTLAYDPVRSKRASGPSPAASAPSDTRRMTALAARVRGEYNEMPGLSPTFGQASRLFGLRADECRQVLELLQREEFLRCGPDGQYRMK